MRGLPMDAWLEIQAFLETGKPGQIILHISTDGLEEVELRQKRKVNKKVLASIIPLG